MTSMTTKPPKKQAGRMRAEDIAVCLALVAIVGAIIASVIGLESYGCHSRWADSGIKSDYRLPGGCMVQRKDGTWWPEQAIRDVGQ